MRAAGEEITEGRVWRLERMRAIQQQVADELARFAQFADGEVTAGMREAIAAGERDALEQLLAHIDSGEHMF